MNRSDKRELEYEQWVETPVVDLLFDSDGNRKEPAKSASSRPMLARQFESVELAADGRNVEMICVPFDIPATVADPPDWTPYEEEFARGAFATTVKAPNRVLLEFEHHHPGLSGILGHGAHLEEQDVGLYGRFRVTDHTDGDKALQLIRDDVLKATSVFYEPIRHQRTEAGVIRRLKVRLDRVALCRVGTWPEARVLAVRSKVEQPVELPRLTFDPELAAYLAAQGLSVPDHLRTEKQ